MHSSGVTLQTYATARLPVCNSGKQISHVIRQAMRRSCRRGDHSARVCRCSLISQRVWSVAAPARCYRPKHVPSLGGERSLLRLGVCRGSGSQQVTQSSPRDPCAPGISRLLLVVCWQLSCCPIRTPINVHDSRWLQAEQQLDKLHQAVTKRDVQVVTQLLLQGGDATAVDAAVSRATLLNLLLCEC